MTTCENRNAVARAWRHDRISAKAHDGRGHEFMWEISGRRGMKMAMTKDEREQRIAGLFCEHMGPQWTIDTKHRERPDFLLSDGKCAIGLELTELRQPGAHDRAINYDTEFKQLVLKTWIDDPQVHHRSVTLRYRLTPGGELEGRYMVPVPKERDGVINELKDLVRSIPPAENQTPIEVRFKGDHPRLANSHLASRYHWVDEKGFPMLHNCFESLRLTYDPEFVQGLPRSNLDVGFVGVVQEDLRTHIRTKLAKLKEYRRRIAAGTRISLLLWSSGRSSTQRLGQIHIEAVRQIVEEEFALVCDRFDAVSWGSDLLMDHSNGSSHEFVQLL